MVGFPPTSNCQFLGGDLYIYIYTIHIYIYIYICVCVCIYLCHLYISSMSWAGNLVIGTVVKLSHVWGDSQLWAIKVVCQFITHQNMYHYWKTCVERIWIGMSKCIPPKHNTDIKREIREHTAFFIHTYIRTYIHTSMHACMHAYTYALIIYIYIHIRAYVVI